METKTQEKAVKIVMLENDFINLLQRHMSNEKDRFVLSFFFKIGEWVYASDGRRAVRISAQSLSCLEDGAYRFQGKPKLNNKTGVSEVVIVNGIDINPPDLNMAWINDRLDRIPICSLTIEGNSINTSSVMINIFKQTARAVNFDYISDLCFKYPEKWDLWTKADEIGLPDKAIMLRIENKNLKHTIEVIMLPFRL